MATLKIDGARFIVTVDPERRIIRDGSILIEGQRIVQVGKATALQHVTADRVIDAHEMVVTPGFCNNHMHISYAHATRGIFPDNLDPMVYLSNVFTLQGAMTEEDEYYTTLLGITELLKYGTTCFLDPGSTKYLDACMQAYEESGCRIVVGEHVTDKPNPLRLPVYPLDEAVRRMETTIQRYDHRLDDRVRAWAMPFDAAFCSDELAQSGEGSRGPLQHGYDSAPVQPARHRADVPRQLWQAPCRVLGRAWESSAPTCSWRTSSTSIHVRWTPSPAPIQRPSCAQPPRSNSAHA